MYSTFLLLISSFHVSTLPTNFQSCPPDYSGSRVLGTNGPDDWWGWLPESQSSCKIATSSATTQDESSEINTEKPSSTGINPSVTHVADISEPIASPVSNSFFPPSNAPLAASNNSVSSGLSPPASSSSDTPASSFGNTPASNSSTTTATGGSKKLLCAGDSLTVGAITVPNTTPMQVIGENPYSNVLSGAGYDVKNVAISGTLTPEILNAISSQSGKYDFVLILAGINDIASGKGIYEPLENIKKMIDVATTQLDAHVILMTLTSDTNGNPGYESQRQEFNQNLSSLGSNSVHLLNLDSVCQQSTWPRSDGVHFQAEGSNSFGKCVLNFLQTIN